MAILPISNRKWFAIFSTIVLTTTILVVLQSSKYDIAYNNLDIDDDDDVDISNGKWRGLQDSEVEKMSVLGRILYLNEKPPAVPNYDRVTYKILIWKYGSTIENRHLKHFTNSKFDPFEHCSVKNCKISYEDSDISSADLVIFHLHRMKGLKDIPRGTRNETQIWAFLTDESPQHTFLNSKDKLPAFNGLFNWSMTYRMDSDIPVPYGRTVALPEPLETNRKPWENKRRDVLVAIMGSNCGSNNHRWKYVKELQKHLNVDIYGKCGTLECPGHFREDCPAIENYMFYLAFENSNCREYITEKLWWNAYHKNAIPIVMGASKSSYKKLLPPRSYIDTENFARPIDLAKYILYMNSTNEFEKFYKWKHRFKVLNEHGYFQTESFHYCRVCEALNYNNKSKKVYNNLENFWSASRDCMPSWDN